MKIDIIATGSSGNCFLFEDTLIIDMGIPMKLLKERVNIEKVTHVLLTHVHGDHFNKATIRNIIANYPQIKFIFGEWMLKPMKLLRVDNYEIIQMNTMYGCGDFKIAGVTAYHDVDNCGYRLVKNGHKHFHITDTCTLQGITAKDYDTATIECNFHKNTALSIIEKKTERGEFSHLIKALINHLDVDDTIAFCRNNGIKKLIPIHIGDSTRKEVIKVIENSGIVYEERS